MGAAIGFITSFFFQADDGIRIRNVTGVQTCALPICKGCFRDPLPWPCLPMPGPRSAQRARAKMLSSMRTPLAQNLSKPALRRQWLIRTGHRHALALVPAATAETVEISRQNGLDRGRRDAEGRERQRARGDDIITL